MSQQAFFKSKLNHQLALRIVLTSVIMSAVVTATQLYFDYQNEYQRVKGIQEQIISSNVISLESDLWNLDFQRIEVEIKSILVYPEIVSVKLSDTGEDDWVVGEALQKDFIESSGIIQHQASGSALGTLSVQSDIRNLYQKLQGTALTIFISYGINTLILAGFVMFFVNRFVTNPLTAMISFFDSMNLGKPIAPLALPPGSEKRDNEVSHTINTINKMCVVLSKSYGDVRESEEALSNALLDRERLLKMEIGFKERLEQQVKERTLELEKANLAKSDFLAKMSHEIRTPMNAIIGMSHLTLETKLNKTQRNYISKVHSAGKNLLGIINDILDYSKIEAGKMTLEETNFSLETVLDNIVNLMIVKIKEKDLELVFNVHKSVPQVLHGDPLRLEQVLVNLVSNATKFTPEGGDILVAIELESSTDSDYVLHFFIKDSGIGMDETQRQKLFKPFSQSDDSITRKYGGTGLGLVICEQLTRLMKGRIWLESELGKGSTFHFTAQFSESTDKPESQLSNQKSFESLSALVVDDNETSRITLSRMLERYGLNVQVASSGIQCIDKILALDATSPFDLVLMDWKMPEQDGIETINQIQNKINMKNMPTVIMVTAHDRQEVSKKSQNIKLSGFLTKPVTPSILLGALNQALGYKTNASATKAEENTGYVKTKVIESLKGVNLLLVEDNKVNQEIALAYLKQQGITAVVANNGQEALDILENNDFDGILMDCQMPVMDGYEATRRIRQNKKYDDLPIIAITANVMSSDRGKSLAAGMNDHISKPINVKNMFKTISKWIRPDANSVSDSVESTPSLINLPSDLAGIDVNQGVEIMAGDENLYREVLIRFRDSHQSFVQELYDMQKMGDYKNMILLTHTLKGLAANIGANELRVKASTLESLCEDMPTSPEVVPSIELLEKSLSVVLDGLAVLE